MTLDKTHWTVRYYIFLLKFAGNESFDIEWRLSRVNDLCQFVRALIFRTVALTVACLMILIATGILFTLIYNEPLKAAIGLGVVVTAVGGVVILLFGLRAFFDYRRALPPKPPGVIRTYASAVKRGVCPLIKIESDYRR